MKEGIENGKKYNLLVESFVKDAFAVASDSENNWHDVLLVKQLKAVMFQLLNVMAQRQSQQVPFIIVAFEPMIISETFGMVPMLIVPLSIISILRARMQRVASLCMLS